MDVTPRKKGVTLMEGQSAVPLGMEDLDGSVAHSFYTHHTHHTHGTSRWRTMTGSVTTGRSLGPAYTLGSRSTRYMTSKDLHTEPPPPLPSAFINMHQKIQNSVGAGSVIELRLSGGEEDDAQALLYKGPVEGLQPTHFLHKLGGAGLSLHMLSLRHCPAPLVSPRGVCGGASRGSRRASSAGPSTRLLPSTLITLPLLTEPVPPVLCHVGVRSVSLCWASLQLPVSPDCLSLDSSTHWPPLLHDHWDTTPLLVSYSLQGAADVPQACTSGALSLRQRRFPPPTTKHREFKVLYAGEEEGVGGGHEVHVTGLSPATWYHFRLHVTLQHHNSVEEVCSEVLSVCTAPHVPDPPTRPTPTLVEESMSGGPVSRLSFHWPAPKCNGSLITHYIIQQRLVHTKASKQHKGKLGAALSLLLGHDDEGLSSVEGGSGGVVKGKWVSQQEVAATSTGTHNQQALLQGPSPPLCRGLRELQLRLIAVNAHGPSKPSPTLRLPKDRYPALFASFKHAASCEPLSSKGPKSIYQDDGPSPDSPTDDNTTHRCGKAVGVASVSPHHHPDDDPPPLQDEAARLCALLPFPMNPGVAASFLQRRKASDAHLSPYAHLPLQVLAPTSSEGPASPQALDDEDSLKHALASRCDWSRACVPVPLLAAAALTLTSSPHRPRSIPPLCPAPPSMLTLSHAPGLGSTLTISSSSVAPAPVLPKAPANPFLLHREVGPVVRVSMPE